MGLTVTISCKVATMKYVSYTNVASQMLAASQK